MAVQFYWLIVALLIFCVGAFEFQHLFAPHTVESGNRYVKRNLRNLSVAAYLRHPHVTYGYRSTTVRSALWGFVEWHNGTYSLWAAILSFPVVAAVVIWVPGDASWLCRIFWVASAASRALGRIVLIVVGESSGSILPDIYALCLKGDALSATVAWACVMCACCDAWELPLWVPLGGMLCLLLSTVPVLLSLIQQHTIIRMQQYLKLSLWASAIGGMAILIWHCGSMAARGPWWSPSLLWGLTAITWHGVGTWCTCMCFPERFVDTWCTGRALSHLMGLCGHLCLFWCLASKSDPMTGIITEAILIS